MKSLLLVGHRIRDRFTEALIGEGVEKTGEGAEIKC
jgi:hypothetical protein